MWIFVLIILTATIAQSVLKMSVLNRLSRTAIISGTIILTALFYRSATQYNLADLKNYLNSSATLGTLCGTIIIQELFMLVFGTIMLRRYYTGKKIRKVNFIIMLPSVLYPLSYQLSLVYLFNTISGIDYYKTNLLLATGTILLTVASAELLSRLNFRKKIEFIALFSIITIFLAMFLPVIFSGSAPTGKIITLHWNMLAGIGIIIIAVLFFTAASYYGLYIKTFQYINKIKEKMI